MGYIQSMGSQIVRHDWATTIITGWILVLNRTSEKLGLIREILLEISVPFFNHKSKTCSDSQSCPTLCDPMDYSLLGSSAHGIFQARMLSGLPFPSLGDLPNPGIKPTSLISPVLAGRFFTTAPPGSPYQIWHDWQVYSPTQQVALFICMMVSFAMGSFSI